MSIAAAQASKFYEQSVKDGSVFTVLDEDSYLIFKIGSTEVIPFWSSRSRVEKVQVAHPKYAGFTISEIPLSEFLNETLPLLEEQNINVGVNWAGVRLVGYDIPVADLRTNIGYWRAKQHDSSVG
jgi:hypothetical protein